MYDSSTVSYIYKIKKVQLIFYGDCAQLFGLFKSAYFVKFETRKMLVYNNFVWFGKMIE